MFRHWTFYDKAKALLVLAAVISFALLLKVSQDQHRRIHLAVTDIHVLTSTSLQSAVERIDIVLDGQSLEHSDEVISELATAFSMVSVLATLDPDRSSEWVQIMETIGFSQRKLVALEQTDLREQSALLQHIRDTLHIVAAAFQKGSDSTVDEDAVIRAVRAGLELRGIKELP